MSNHALSLPMQSMPRAAALLGLSELVLTSIHHAYGAYLYDTPWRYQVVVFALVMALGISGLSFAAHRHEAEPMGRPLLWLNMATILIVPVLVIGLIEGGYNHFVKDIVYLAGDTALFHRMFPVPPYEAPGDWFFEVTGVAQFALGLWAGLSAIKALRSRA